MYIVKKSALALFLAAPMATSAWAGDYHLGEGYSVGKVNIAGYVNLVAEHPAGGKTELVGDDISLFIGARFNKYVNPFFEAELSNATIWRQHSSLFANSHPEFVLERLYNDSHLSDNLSLRAGKMLTPVGEWNGIHAAPLVATTTRPMTTRRSFPEYTSGLALNYTPTNGALPEIQAYWQPGLEWAPRPRTLAARDYRNIAGLHLNWSSELTDKIGLSLQHGDVANFNESQALLGLNARKTVGPFQLETEATITQISGQNRARLRDREWGAYVLGSYALDERWSLLARYEHFSDRNAAQGSRNALLGLSWRSNPAVVWKLEYVKQSGARLDISTGLVGSISVLF
jgi:hypothetical protein